MHTNLEILTDVKDALRITLKKIDDAIADEKKSTDKFNTYPNRKFAAAKRSALDLKIELTKLTQSSKYKFQEKL